MFSLNNTAPLARQVDIQGKRSDKLNFPSTRSALWDPKPKGKPIGIHPTQFRNCSVTFEEQTLRLAQRLSQDCADDSYRCTFQGSIYRQPDGEGMCVCVERLDFNRRFSGSSLPDEVTVPFVLRRNGLEVDMVAAEDYVNSIKAVQENCSVKDKIELSRFVSLRSSGSIRLNKDNMNCSLDIDLVMAETSFKATLINAVPIVPSALSKNLSGPISVSEVQGEPKTGFLTMDQTRKLLLVLESDPKASSLPLVGIWVSGITAVYDSYVWAACLRYLHNTAQQDRVCVPPEHFLVVMFSPLHSKPEFYQVTTDNGKPDLKMALYTSHTNVIIPNGSSERPSSPIEVELEQVANGDKANLFHAALYSTKELLVYKRIRSVTPKRVENSTTHEDITPRNIPAPHLSKTQLAKPLVPEVSLLYDDEPHTTIPVPTAKPSPHFEKSVVGKSPQVRDLSRAPLKPVNRTASGPVHPPTKGGLDSQARQANYPQQQHLVIPGYSFPAQNSQMTPPAVLSYPSALPGQHMHLPVTMHPQPQPITSAGYYPSPNYPLYHPHMTPHVRGPVTPNVYPGQPMPHHYMTNTLPQAPGNMYHGPIPQQCTMSQHTAFKQLQTAASAAPAVQQQRPIPPSNGHPAPAATNVHHHNGKAAAPPHNSPGEAYVQPLFTGPDSPPGPTGGSPIRQNVQQASAGGSPIQPSISQPVSASASPGSVSNSSIGSNGSQVPPEVLQLLQHQDQQLRELKEQLASLLAKQQNTPESNSPHRQAKDLITTATQMSAAQSPIKVNPNQRETCTIATNTSLWYPHNDSHNHTSQTHDGTTETQDSGRGSQRHDTHDSWRTMNDTGNVHHHYFQTPDQKVPRFQSDQVIQHSPMNQQFDSPRQQPDKGVQDTQSSPGRTINNNISLNDLHAGQIPDQCEEESVLSQMIVDMPAYTSMSPERLAQHSAFNDSNDSTRSPQIGESVSMYDEQQPEVFQTQHNGSHEDVDNGPGSHNTSLLIKDAKVFYKNFIGNIQKVLHNQSVGQQDESDMSVPGKELQKHPTHMNSTLESTLHHSADDGTPEKTQNSTKSEADQTVDIAEVTRRQLQRLGVDLDGLSSNDSSMRGEQSLFLFDHSMLMLPRVNYTSLMLDSDSDVSADADALAMKYLSDEQLAELAKLRIQSPKSKRGRGNDIGLERLLNNANSEPSPGVSVYGMSANNMSFATKKFLEKYGLAAGVKPDVENSTEDFDDSTEDNTSRNNEASNTSLHDVRNVKDVLHRIVHQKFLASGSFCEVSNDNAEISGGRRADQSCVSNCSSGSSHRSERRGYHGDEDYQMHSEHRQHSTTSDTTQYRTPNHTRIGHGADDQYEKASSDHTPVRVFDESFKKRHQIRPQDPQDLFKPDGSNEPSSQGNKTGRQILDIERLKGLPKLL